MRRLFASVGLLALAAAGPARAAGDVLRGGMLATGAAPSTDAWERGDGRGVTIAGRSTTDWRLRFVRTAYDEVLVSAPLVQTYSFAARDDAPRRRVSFEASFRGRTDLASGGFSAEVLTAFVDLEPSARWGLVRVGRQLVTTSGSDGFTRLDGVRARLTLHRVGVEAFAGVPLRSRLVAAVPTTGTEGAPPPTGWGRDFTWGAALFLAGHEATQLRLGIQDRLRDGALNRRHVQVDLSQGFFGRALLRGSLAVNLLQRRLDEANAALDVRPVAALLVGVEYRRWQATFDADAIWSVFDTDPYDQIEGRIEATPARWLRLWLAGGVQGYPQAVTQDGVPRAEVGRVSGTLRGGATLRPVQAVTLDLQQRTVTGTGGTKVMVGGSVGVEPLRGRLRLVARGDLQRYGFALQPGLTGEYGSAGIELVAAPTAFVQARVSADRIFTPFLKNQAQVSASLHFLLGVTRRGAAPASDALAWEPALLLAAGAADPRAREAIPGLGGGIGLGRGAP